MDPRTVAVILPALNEEEALPLVLRDLKSLGLLESTVVVDNGSRDGTARVAAEAGVLVVAEARRGYGAACLRGIRAVEELLPGREIIVFLDADRSDDPFRIPDMVAALEAGTRDLVIGSRTLGQAERGSLSGHQRLGNALYCGLIGILFGHRYSDLGPFRAIRTEALRRLRMSDQGFGWTVEMQVRAIQEGLRIQEVPVAYRRRVGESKISGTLSGSAGAALKIGWTILRLRLKPRRLASAPRVGPS